MLVPQMLMVHISTILFLWMVLNTFVTDSLGVALVLMALIVAAVQYIRIPPLHESKISPIILDLFRVDRDKLEKNMIFHKAGAFHAPENTLEAVQEAIKLGIPAVEIDLDFTKDDVGVLIHGPRIDETTDGTGFVKDYTFQELQRLSASANDASKDKFPDVRVPTLESCVQMCIENRIIMFIDCKSNSSQTAKLMASLYDKYPELYGLGVVCSFYPTIIYAVRQIDSNILTGLTHREFVLTTQGSTANDRERNRELWKRLICPFLDSFLSWAHWAFLWYICGNSFFLGNKDKLCLEAKKFWSRLNVRILAWTVNDPLEKEYFLKCLEIPVITDGLQPDHFISIVPKMSTAL